MVVCGRRKHAFEFIIELFFNAISVLVEGLLGRLAAAVFNQISVCVLDPFLYQFLQYFLVELNMGGVLDSPLEEGYRVDFLA